MLKMTPNISTAAVQQSIEFLERQKEGNCPCTIHTQKRGYDWIFFNRIPDRSSTEENSHMSDSDDSEYEEAVDTTTDSQDPQKIDEGEEAEDEDTIKINQDVTDASGASSEDFTSADVTASYHSIFNPKVSDSLLESSLNCRDNRTKKNDTKQTQKQKKCKKPTKTSKSKSSKSEDDQAEMISDDILEESHQGIDSSFPCKFDQIVYRDNVNDKTYSFRYFKTFKFV